MAALRSTEWGSGARLHCERAKPEADSNQPLAITSAPHIMAQLLVAGQTICRGAHVAPSKRRGFAGDCSLTAGTPRASVDAWAFCSFRTQAPSRGTAASMVWGGWNRGRRCPRSRI